MTDPTADPRKPFSQRSRRQLASSWLPCWQPCTAPASPWCRSSTVSIDPGVCAIAGVLADCTLRPAMSPAAAGRWYAQLVKTGRHHPAGSLRVSTARRCWQTRRHVSCSTTAWSPLRSPGPSSAITSRMDRKSSWQTLRLCRRGPTAR